MLAAGKGNIQLAGDGKNSLFAAGQYNVQLSGSQDDFAIALGQANVTVTSSGRDTIVAGGQYNVVFSGGDADTLLVGGETNVVATGWGNDTGIFGGKNNIVLLEGGNDTAIIGGQTNVAFAGSGDDKLVVAGESNYVAAGTGSDMLIVAGKNNWVATDNDIIFNFRDLPNGGKYSVDYKKNKNLSEYVDHDIANGLNANLSASAEIKLSGELAAVFPDIEFSQADTLDWSLPTFTVPQFDFEIPDLPELKTPDVNYRYGQLSRYGIPTISLPTISTPEFQTPNITVPSITIPKIGDMSVDVREWDVQGSYDFDLSLEGSGKAVSDLLGKLTGTTQFLGDSLDAAVREAADTANSNDLSLFAKGEFDLSNDPAKENTEENEAGINYIVDKQTEDFEFFVPLADALTDKREPVSRDDGDRASYEFSLPTISIGALSAPDLRLNAFSFEGFSSLLAKKISGRDFYGYEAPDFSLPEIKTPEFDLYDVVGAENLTSTEKTFSLPTIKLPEIQGIDWAKYIPDLNTRYDLLQDNGDMALVAGETNKVLMGGGDDVAIVAGKTNFLQSGDGDDIALVAGETNTWQGNRGNDLALVGGKDNTLFAGNGNDVLVSLGKNNTVHTGIGRDITLAVGDSNKISALDGDDLLVAIGRENTVEAGDGKANSLVSIGKTNTITGANADDLAIAIGQTNTINAKGGDDTLTAIGQTNTINGGTGNDVLLAVGDTNILNGEGDSGSWQ